MFLSLNCNFFCSFQCDKAQKCYLGVQKLIENEGFLRVLTLVCLIMKTKNMKSGVLLNFSVDIFGDVYQELSLI